MASPSDIDAVFFCVIQLRRNWCERFGHTRAIVCVYPYPPMFCIANLHVPTTFIASPSAEMSSIMCVVSGSISMLCFLTKFASTQSMLAPVSWRALSVDNVLLLVFTFKFIIGVGDPGTSALVTGLETEFFHLLVFSLFLHLH